MSSCLGPLAPKLSESHSPFPPDVGGDTSPGFHSTPFPIVARSSSLWQEVVHLCTNPSSPQKRNTSNQIRRLRKWLLLALEPGGIERGRGGDPSKLFSKPPSALSRDLVCKMPGCEAEGSSEITEPGVPGFRPVGITCEAV